MTSPAARSRGIANTEKPSLSRAAARAFRKRWDAVRAVEKAELRAMSVEEKLRQLGALMLSGRALGWDTKTAREVQRVRARWNRLRRVLRA